MQVPINYRYLFNILSWVSNQQFLAILESIIRPCDHGADWYWEWLCQDIWETCMTLMCSYIPKHVFSIYHVPEVVSGSGDTVVTSSLHGVSNLIVDFDTNKRVMQTWKIPTVLIIMKTHRAEYRMEWWEQTKAADKMEKAGRTEGHFKDIDLVLWAKRSHLIQGWSDINQLHF